MTVVYCCFFWARIIPLNQLLWSCFIVCFCQADGRRHGSGRPTIATGHSASSVRPTRTPRSLWTLCTVKLWILNQEALFSLSSLCYGWKKFFQNLKRKFFPFSTAEMWRTVCPVPRRLLPLQSVQSDTQLGRRQGLLPVRVHKKCYVWFLFWRGPVN